MFEKEAEEYLKTDGTKAEQILNMLNEISPLKITINQLPFVLAMLQQVYQDGAEFGYNKANEWHKPSEKLPEECTLVLAYLFEETEPTICEYVVSDQWECLPRRIVFCSNDQVRKWKEIILPELKESE